MLRFLAATLLAVVAMFPAEGIAQPLRTGSESRIRNYYVAADEVEWDYAPGGVNKMMGMKFEGNSKVFTERGPHRIGTVYRKALYREYTDATFTKLKPRAPE
jgi:hephaestin